MYLSTENNFKLDEIIKSFEVAYRSHIVDALINKFPILSRFSVAITKIEASLNHSSVILSKKFKLKAQRIKREVGAHYQKIQDCYTAYKNSDYQNDVPYVSEILDYIDLFFDECFQNLANDFTTVEEFKDYSSKYQFVRNSLSHPASSKIEIQHSKEVISYIKKLLLSIDDDKFWYVSKKDISSISDSFIQTIDNIGLKIHNLDEVSFPHGKIVCRDTEIETLRNLIFGKDERYRKSGSVVIYGYGGVGKTALVLEFVYQTIKEINDKKIKNPYEFILFFTSKEEILSYKETSGEIYINSIKKQIISFEDFKNKIFLELVPEKKELTEKNKGLIIIDNFETLTQEDKILFFDFIKHTPRSIQFILTSRNEEACEDKLNLKEFREISAGLKFIDEYLIANDINLPEILTTYQKRELAQLSKGNTLIIVLTIQLLKKGAPVEQILNDLRSVESSNMEMIADFMYKNTIQETISELENNKYSPVEVLKVISLYEVPIDLYSLSFLSKQNILSVESTCQTFSSRLVFEKIGESYKPNDFANKFIISKYLPNNVEKKEIRQRIREYQKRLEIKLQKFESTKRREPLLKGIMEDWKPKNSIDTIAIAESFVLFGETKEATAKKDYVEIRRIVQEFERIEKMTSHPYIRFQKARCFELFLNAYSRADHRKVIIEKISKSYEDAIEATDFYYPYIKNTKSYASINWIYGLFISTYMDDLKRAARYIEDAIVIFKKLKIRDKTYYTALNNLSWIYDSIYNSTGDKRYIYELKPIYLEIIKNENEARRLGFRYALYRNNFSKYFSRR